MREHLRRTRHDLGYLALRGLLTGARPFSLPTLRRLGRLLAGLTPLFGRAERQRARDHLRLAFPDWEPARHSRVFRDFVRHTGELLGEVAWLWSAPAQAILAASRFEGLEHLTGCLGPETGTVLLTGHCGDWEWLNLALGAAGVPMTAAAREIFDPRVDRLVQQLRGRFGAESALRGQRAGHRMVSALNGGRVVGILIDQDIDAPGAFVEFFGRPAWTPTGAAVIAARCGRPIVPGFSARLEDGTMLLAFDAPLATDRDAASPEGAARLTARLTARIEAQIRSRPEQWVWSHRRWRRQPGAGDRVWRAES